MAQQQHKIALAQAATARGWAKTIGTSSKDAQVINGVVEVSANQVIGTKTASISKRGGSTTSSSIGSGVVALKCYALDFAPLSATSTALFSSTTNIGTITALPDAGTNYLVADSVISGVQVIAFASSDGAGWFCYSDAISTNFPTFTGNRTSGSAVISGIVSTTGIYKGQAISGDGIPANTRVLSVDSSTQITMSANATSGAGTATTITKEALSKITDTDFPSNATSMVAMDGYFFAGSPTLGICQSAINDPATWASADRIVPDYAGDKLNRIFKIGNHVVSSGTLCSVQYFYNAGNASGSVLSSAENLNILGLLVICSPVPFADGHYCIAQPGAPGSGNGPLGLYRLTGVNSFQRVSDDVLTGVITDGQLTRIGQIESSGKSLVACHSGSAATFPVYDPVDNSATFFSLSAALTSAHGLTFTKSGSDTLFLWATGNTWTDSSVAYTLTIQTEPQDMAAGGATTDNQAVLLADTESTGTASLDTTDDDYTNWVNKGSFDMTADRKEVWALGWHRGPRAYRITHSANTGFRGQILRINHSPSN